MLLFGVLITTKGFTVQMLTPGNRENMVNTSNASCGSQSVALESVELTETIFVIRGVFPVCFMVSFISIKQQKKLIKEI